MTKVRVAAYSISLDGYGAGPDQSLEAPLGIGAEALHAWAFAKDAPVDAGLFKGSLDGLGAWILGRNMFAHSRGPWTDDGWRGWWGEEPPYHCPVFVLTNHPRDSFEMKGGTVFHFVTGGIHEAMDAARAAAGEQDIRIGGGAETIRQYLRERMIDELHIAVAPVLLGRGEPLFEELDMTALGYGVTKRVEGEGATHYWLARGD